MRICVAVLSIALLSNCVAEDDGSYAETPRERYIANFNYFWDMKSDRGLSFGIAPFYGSFTPKQMWRYDDCGLESECSWDSGYIRAEENSFLMEPYTPDELRGGKFDYAFVDICTLNPFSPLEDRVQYYTFASAEDKNFDVAIGKRESRLAERIFTDQYLNYIDADFRLRADIKSSGLESRGINAVLRDAWLKKRLKRPAALYILDGCGAGELPVKFAFIEPTARIQLITEFDYRICKESNLDPWNVDQCPSVKDFLGRDASLAGSYRARVTRSSGQVIYREFTVTDDDENRELKF